MNDETNEDKRPSICRVIGMEGASPHALQLHECGCRTVDGAWCGYDEVETPSTPEALTAWERKNIREWTQVRLQPRKLPDDVVRLLDHADYMDAEVAKITGYLSVSSTLLTNAIDERERAVAIIKRARDEVEYRDGEARTLVGAALIGFADHILAKIQEGKT